MKETYDLDSRGQIHGIGLKGRCARSRRRQKTVVFNNEAFAGLIAGVNDESRVRFLFLRPNTQAERERGESGTAPVRKRQASLNERKGVKEKGQNII